MARYVDTDLLKPDYFVPSTSTGTVSTQYVSLFQILNAPTADVVAVVRCKDCKWFDITAPSGTVEPIGFRCKRRMIFVDADDFCKRGERREE